MHYCVNIVYATECLRYWVSAPLSAIGCLRYWVSVPLNALLGVCACFQLSERDIVIAEHEGAGRESTASLPSAATTQTGVGCAK